MHFHVTNSIGLSVGSECVTFESISSHTDTSNNIHDIGWIKVISCTESGESYTSSPFTFHRNDYLTLALRTISIKFQPPGGISNANYNNLTVIAKPYSNPIQYGLRNVKETSYQYDTSGNFIDYGDTNNWIGSATALNRMSQYPPWCSNNNIGHPLHERVYHGCGNDYGIHILPNRDQTKYYVCSWEWAQLLGEDIEIYFGFALNDTLCDTDAPTISPTDPTANPTTHPTTAPTQVTSSPTPLTLSPTTTMPSMSPIVTTDAPSFVYNIILSKM